MSEGSASPVAWWADDRDTDAVVATYGTAIVDEAVAGWTLPDEQRRSRLRQLPGFRTYLQGLVAQRAVLVAGHGDVAGCSVWVSCPDPADPGPDGAGPDDASTAALLQEVYGEYAPRVALVAERTARVRPMRGAYLHLQQMAVHPDRRGGGVGAAMLRAGLADADTRGLPVHLEASTARNRALYLRHGFADVGEPVVLPDDGPTLQPMRRAPSGAGSR